MGTQFVLKGNENVDNINESGYFKTCNNWQKHENKISSVFVDYIAGWIDSNKAN